MKKIGIIDYFIDEWHSNVYTELFEKANEELGLDYQISYGYAEIDKDGRLTTDEWCKKKNITRCHSIEELCELSDNILILAPANPERHLKYAQMALPYGKATYIDKTFAPDLKTAKEIFEIAEKYGTKIFTSSALRYAEEIAEYSNVKNVIITGNGRSLEEYIIHQIEMAVKMTNGQKAESVQVFNQQNQATIVIRFSNAGATLNYSTSKCGFSVDVETESERCDYKKIEKGTEFYFLLRSILSFFDSNIEPVSKDETLAVLSIRDAILKGTEAAYGEKILVENYTD